MDFGKWSHYVKVVPVYLVSDYSKLSDEIWHRGPTLTILALFILYICNANRIYNDSDNDNDKPIKSLLKGKGLLPLVGLARLDS
jgi:hypothetical protein